MIVLHHHQALLLLPRAGDPRQGPGHRGDAEQGGAARGLHRQVAARGVRSAGQRRVQHPQLQGRPRGHRQVSQHWIVAVRKVLDLDTMCLTFQVPRHEAAHDRWHRPGGHGAGGWGRVPAHSRLQGAVSILIVYNVWCASNSVLQVLCQYL